MPTTATDGAYFVTICTQGREQMFGAVLDDAVELSDAGQMIRAVWHELPHHLSGVACDEHVVMPNHFHGIIVLIGSPSHTATLFDVVARLKSLTTNRYRRGVLQRHWHPFQGRLWQRNYYERIIRDEEELNRVRQYIIDNPARWSDDEYHLPSP